MKRGWGMRKYIIRSLLQIIPVIIIISFIVFFLIFIAGDPVDLMLPLEATEEDI